MSIGQVFGWVMVALVVVLMTINGSIMLVSPRAWFRLLGWLRAQGTLTEDRYSAGWGAIQLRLAGGLIVASIIWTLYEVFR